MRNGNEKHNANLPKKKSTEYKIWNKKKNERKI